LTFVAIRRQLPPGYSEDAMRLSLLVFLLLPGALSAQVYQGDPAIGSALALQMEAGTKIIDSYLFPNDADPAKATEALGVLYTEIEGAAGNFNVDVGLFRRVPEGYQLVGKIPDLYGTDPRDAKFLPDRVMLTTTTLKPDDARCCPSGTTVWTVPRATLSAVGQQQ
jgi:hypothetical protein